MKIVSLQTSYTVDVIKWLKLAVVCICVLLLYIDEK